MTSHRGPASSLEILPPNGGRYRRYRCYRGERGTEYSSLSCPLRGSQSRPADKGGWGSDTGQLIRLMRPQKELLVQYGEAMRSVLVRFGDIVREGSGPKISLVWRGPGAHIRAYMEYGHVPRCWTNWGPTAGQTQWCAALQVMMSCRKTKLREGHGISLTATRRTYSVATGRRMCD